MATIDWPSAASFVPRSVEWGVSTPKSRWVSLFTGQEQSISHLADRLRLMLELPPCGPEDGARREAWVGELLSAGHTVRIGHLVRPEPVGTLRGTPTVLALAVAGARTVQLLGTAAATLVGGDLLGVGNQLLLVGYAGAVANGSGVITVPLVRPVQVALAAGAAVTWQAPTGLWQMAAQELSVGYGRGRWQRAITLSFREVY